MKHIGLFEGIGGFSLAVRWMGWETIAWCEINQFGQKVLGYHFPNANPHYDIKTTDFSIYRGQCDILTGGFPCQPFSNSGEQQGENDERYLFEQMLRAVREIKPRWVVAENVYSITSPKFKKLFHEICTSLENEGYKVQPYIIPATAVEAEHERNRVWIVAYSDGIGLSGQGSLLGQLQPTKIGNRKTSGFVNFVQRNAMPFVCSSHYGFPRKLAEYAIHGAGNAIVPQVALQIFKAIVECQNEMMNNERLCGVGLSA